MSVTAVMGFNQDTRQLSYKPVKVIGAGSFGTVVKAIISDTGEEVAIKKVLQDKRFKNRELELMLSLDHPNIVGLRCYFHSQGGATHPARREDVYLNLVLEYMPDTVAGALRACARARQPMRTVVVKLYVYQLLLALDYMHGRHVCHRDVKPQNLLVNTDTCVLKLCDMGSAKRLVRGEPNVSYICSRYYRAPELVFGAAKYSTQIDIWSSGCVLAELLIGQPVFYGQTGADQIVEIMKILGTPTRDEIRAMNEHYSEFKFPQLPPRSWSKVRVTSQGVVRERWCGTQSGRAIQNHVFKSRTTGDLVDLTAGLLQYTPARRLTPARACEHSYFDALRNPHTTLPSGAPLPPLTPLSKPAHAPRPAPCSDVTEHTSSERGSEAAGSSQTQV